MTLEESEREQILRTLEITQWRIKGPRGAAEQLGVNPSTLYSRMEKLGIPTRRQKDQARC
jgi:transcriptional regulator with GAF, ATPase, and Fis domain